MMNDDRAVVLEAYRRAALAGRATIAPWDFSPSVPEATVAAILENDAAQRRNLSRTLIVSRRVVDHDARKQAAILLERELPNQLLCEVHL